MKFFRNYLVSRNGFTLIEIILTLAIMGIIMVSISNLFISGYNFYKQNEDKAEVQREIRFITNYIDENTKFTENIEVVNSVDITNLDANEIALGEEENYFVVKTYNGSINTRNLSNIKISSFQFTRNLNELNYTISDFNDVFTLNTKTILNNINKESSITDHYIIIDK